MTYAEELAAERAWHEQCSRPGKPPINRTSPCFVAGQQSHYWGKSRDDCPYASDGEAARHWLAGWDDEANADHCKV